MKKLSAVSVSVMLFASVGRAEFLQIDMSIFGMD